jgi:hypothetical protein
MAGEGVLNESLEMEGLGEPALNGCFPFEVLVSFGEVAGSSELSEALFLAVGPKVKRACALAC